MAWIELVSSKNKKNIFVNSDHIYAVQRQSGVPMNYEQDERARILFATSHGAAGGGQSSVGVDVEQTVEEVMQLLQRSGEHITTIAED